jgi:hypothetical protein
MEETEELVKKTDDNFQWNFYSYKESKRQSGTNFKLVTILTVYLFVVSSSVSKLWDAILYAAPSPNF